MCSVLYEVQPDISSVLPGMMLTLRVKRPTSNQSAGGSLEQRAAAAPDTPHRSQHGASPSRATTTATFSFHPAGGAVSHGRDAATHGGSAGGSPRRAAAAAPPPAPHTPLPGQQPDSLVLSWTQLQGLLLAQQQQPGAQPLAGPHVAAAEVSQAGSGAFNDIITNPLFQADDARPHGSGGSDPMAAVLHALQQAGLALPADAGAALAALS